MGEGKLSPEEALREFKRVAEETERLARLLYGEKWEEAVEKLEDLYDGDPWEVLEHLKREAARRGLLK